MVFSRKSDQSTALPSEVEYKMNEYSTEAKKRSEIFKGIVEKQGLTLLPGRYGGEFNNDMLAVGKLGDSFSLALGMKVSGKDGGIQLDNLSMGHFMQTSRPWVEMVISSLNLHPEFKSIANDINNHLLDGSLRIFILYIDLETKGVNMLPVELSN